jgi:pentapeptide repeat protein
MKKITINNHLTGAIIHEGNFKNLRECAEDAVLIGVDLVSANLSGAYLGNADLGGANLVGAYLRRAKLRGAKLRGAKLRGAYLVNANLGGANLVGADLVNADLGGANLVGANLVNANLVNANLRGANLGGADLSGTTPPIIAGSRHPVIRVAPGKIQIGCQTRTDAWWRSQEARELAKQEGYTPEQIHEYEGIVAKLVALP